ncbi:DUF3667 domain-containing protein [Litorilituus sediminis]|uniref:DUF3667 domain-containing protein n=1 Tax=Litorilituus sediminis TaxID=718192 RepID=A0A4P6P521_9GAMM|nr:DUF3667 domain-containing protein [Litorilituus sediminis]QBG36048.1 DUF3667 domain-containing protein [Litorilituus sediminis]
MSVESLDVSEKHHELQPQVVQDKSCENCGAPLDGQFCAKCGQEITSNIRYFGTVILHLLDDIFSFDSRASRTLWPLIAKPGFLTQKYFEGKRVHYVPPLRLYLFISIIFFLSLKFFTNFGAGSVPVISAETMQQNLANKIVELHSSEADVDKQASIARLQILLEQVSQNKRIPLQNQAIKLAQLELKQLSSGEGLSKEEKKKYDELQNNVETLKTKDSLITVSNQEDGTLRFDFLSEEMNTKLTEQVTMLKNKAEIAFSSDPSKLIEQAIGKLPQLMFVLLPVFALLLKVMYLFSNRLYMEHLTVALHSHSFIFLAILLLELLSEGQDFIVETSAFAADMMQYLAIILLTWLPVYLFIMQRRIYQQGYFFTSIKFVVIASIYLMLMLFTAFIAFIWGLTSI